MTDANTLNSLPLSGAQPTRWDVLLAAPQSKMTHSDSSAPLMAASRKAHSALVFATGADRADHFRVLVPALVSAVVSATDASVVSKRKVNVSSR
jgi:hypothetical protein